MICARMTLRAPKKLALVACAGVAALTVSACGSQTINVAPQYRHGAQIFEDHCSGCHTLAVVGAEGSATSVGDRTRVNGPNFNFRKEEVDQALYAIHNGGFSGAIMPQNIVTGADAQAVAEFLAAYSGKEAQKVPQPTPSS
jgi:mono/diheme cytochrome c family protein